MIFLIVKDTIKFSQTLYIWTKILHLLKFKHDNTKWSYGRKMIYLSGLFPRLQSLGYHRLSYCLNAGVPSTMRARDY